MEKQEIISAVAEESIDLATIPQASTLAEITSLPGIATDGSLKRAPLSLIGNQVTSEVNAKTSAIQSTAQTAQATATQAAATAEAAKLAVFRDGWTAAGGKWNATTGFYELNGLTDITYEQAVKIMYCHGSYPLGFFTWSARTNLPIPGYKPRGGMYGSTADLSSICYNNKVIEVLDIATTTTTTAISNMSCMCLWASNLRRIQGVLTCSGLKDDAGYRSAFRGCTALEDVYLRDFNINIYWNESPNMSLESIRYACENRPYSKATAITMYLHQNAFDRLTDEIIQIANDNNVTIVVGGAL